MNLFFNSQFNYCPLVWILHSRSINNKISRLQERVFVLHIVILSHPLEVSWKNMAPSQYMSETCKHLRQKRL